MNIAELGKIIWGSNLGVYENDILLSVTQVSNGFITHTSACNGFITCTSECNEPIFWICVFSRKILKHLAKSWVLHANIFTIYLKAFINEWIFGSKCFKTETKWKSISYNYTNLDQYMTPIETTLILVLIRVLALLKNNNDNALSLSFKIGNE